MQKHSRINILSKYSVFVKKFTEKHPEIRKEMNRAYLRRLENACNRHLKTIPEESEESNSESTNLKKFN